MIYWTKLLDLLKKLVNTSAIALSLPLGVLILLSWVQPASAAIGGVILYKSPTLSQSRLQEIQQVLKATLIDEGMVAKDGVSPFLPEASSLPALFFKQGVVDDMPPEPQETLDWNFWDRPDGDLLHQSLLSPLSWPMETYELSSGFGRRWGRAHTGLDLTAPRGTTVYSAATGIVVSAGFEQGYGRMVVIEHGDGLKTRYAHLSRADVIVGQFVFNHQEIGAVGMTGHTTGPHLHFEVLVHGNFADPEDYLPA